jgi:Flp pilus assembly secretin CpaC/tetratricopeptide (TPR) repeat protein
MLKLKFKNQIFSTESLLLLFSLLIFSCFNVLADIPIKNINMIQKNIVSENEKTEKQIEKQKKEVDQLISAHLFEKASLQITELRKMTAKLGSSEYVREKLKSIDILEKKLYTEWSAYLENKAESSSLNREWNDSLSYAQESIKKLKAKNIDSPQIIEKNNEVIEKAKHGLSTNEFNKITSIDNIIPDYGEELNDIKKYFTLAETYSKAQEYEKARDMLEKVLILEPYNYKATYELKQIYQKVAGTGYKRKYMQMKERLAQTEWGYTLPIKSQISKKQIIPTTESKDTTTDIEKKLDSIILPKVEFDGAPLSAVIDYIRKESEIYDTEDNLGINLDLRTSSVAQNVNTSSNEDESTETTQQISIENTPITMHLTNIPLGELIKLVCSYANLYYKVEEHSVIISDTSIENMILKYIPLKSDIINSIADINNFEINESADIEGIEELSDEKSDITSVEITDDIIKTFFLERGVPFPGDSTISWDMASSTLIAKNTPENIKTLTNLLHEIDINMPLVLIEVKFVELTYDKEKGLAFNWRINLEGTNWGINQIGQGSGIEGNDFMNQTGDLLNLFKFSQDPINIGNAAGALDFFVYAIEQTKMGETLSSPRIITKSGSTALFEMVEKNYYATSWTVTDPEVVYETVQISPPTPEFEEMKMGIILQVTPTVSPNYKTVFMDVYPVIKEFQSYDDKFQYSVTNINSGTESDSETAISPFVSRDLKMPIIIDRDIKSKLKINDGETVVLGGMLKDTTQTVQDKYPFFGDIPLLGRFFRSEYEVVEQTNLLIFVTAKLINPDGSLLHKPKTRGMFEFKNI